MFGHDNHDNNGQDQQVAVDNTVVTPTTDDNNSNGSLPTDVLSSADTKAATHATTNPASQDLLGIKQKALQELTPLVHHLDQDPLEKFQTTMMMIQASDDQSLLNEAYTSAQAIKDDKAKAQALLDIVKEINYFTQERS
jgi:LPS O-antigen subunit length determinant protein (WzzB/FepE family)